MLARFARDNDDGRCCVRMNHSLKHLYAVDGPHSQVGDHAYETRVAVGKKIQWRFVDPSFIPARGKQVRKSCQNASIIVNHGNGPNRRRDHYFLRLVESNKELALASGIELADSMDPPVVRRKPLLTPAQTVHNNLAECPAHVAVPAKNYRRRIRRTEARAAALCIT